MNVIEALFVPPALWYFIPFRSFGAVLEETRTSREARHASYVFEPRELVEAFDLRLSGMYQQMLRILRVQRILQLPWVSEYAWSTVLHSSIS
mmetsp:Transcript_14457/g.36552  ORF Transcript_14457/g.36552 Transcript_14457/m.36552 type:complete len:92 (+) Transcript_14457:2571-2846(+)